MRDGKMAQWLRVLASLEEPSSTCQHPHDSSQLSVTPVPGTLMPASGLYRCKAHSGVQIYMQAKHSYTQNQ